MLARWLSVPACTVVDDRVSDTGAGLLEFPLQIQLSHNDVVMVGGMESMSQCPFYVKDARFGARLGNRVLEDGLVHDGLMEPGEISCHMGMHAELCASTHKFSRE